MPENRYPGEGVPPGAAADGTGAPPAGPPTAAVFAPPGGLPPQPPPQPYGYGPGHAYGAPWPGPGRAPLPPPPPVSGLCTAAMVLGIVSIVLVTTLYGIVLAVFTAPVAVGLGIAARRRVGRGEAYGGGQATAGLVLGAISLAVSVAAVALVVWFVLHRIESVEEDLPRQDGTHHTQVLDTAAAGVADPGPRRGPGV
ncbi:DUF4190 domain-containing protein [Streptomyces sp. DH37]|uniref:DUF4190 domain-containing protein n=1 Tax=Streptomyces sp. DH37 TaxID=3040122 RepID=UPI002441595F|nr:DUF4190 domain-containing protein [Streptomyces sp. DH37]MDG9705466.1 DUF4190 domain-containing protein [Streptomyces sp. DH37]